MAVNLGRDNLPWSADTWRDIDAAVLGAAGPLRTAQKVFPAATDGNGQYVPDDALPNREGATALEIPEGRTRPYVELSVDVALTQAQVENEDTLHTGRTLAVLAAKEIAQAEDTLFFQGADALARGLLRVANSGGAASLLNLDGAQLVEVPGEDAGYGLNTFRAVVDGIGVLTAKGQPGPYALMLAIDVFADAYAPVGGTLTTTADRLTPLLPGGFYGTGTLPGRTGLLVSLGGQPTMLYVGQDLITAYAQSNDKGQTVLRVYERVQMIARDPTAIVKLAFR
jgi:uncharacterized linocin/CFP29 family protein